MHQFDQFFQCDNTFFHQFCVKNGEGGFQTYNTHHAFFQTLRLFLSGVGCMVCSDHVDGAVQDTFDQCFLVFCRADRGIHFESAVFLQHGIVHGQVVRCCFAGHIQTARFRLTDQFHAFFCGNVADMIFHACFLHQFQVSFDLLPFAFGADAFMSMFFSIFTLVDVTAEKQGVVFTVGCNDHVVAADFFHGFQHHFVILHAATVVGEGADMGSQFVDSSQSFTHFTDGESAVGDNFDAGCFADGFQLGFQICHAVGGRVQIRHGADCGVAAVCCCQSAGFDGLFIKKARLSQMYVNINKTGKYKQTVHIKNGALTLRCTAGNFADDTVGDKYVGFDEIALNKYVCVSQNVVQSDLSFRSLIGSKIEFSLNLQYYITKVISCQDFVCFLSVYTIRSYRKGYCGIY